MVVYLDVLFGVNALMDYTTLLAAARLGGVSVKRRRLLGAAAVGGTYSAAAMLFPALALAPLRILSGIGLCAAAFAGPVSYTHLGDARGDEEHQHLLGRGARDRL